MSTRSTLPFLVVVFVVALAGTLAAMALFNSRMSPRETTVMVTVEVIITPTPNLTPAVTIVTATPDVARTQVALPSNLVTEAAGTVPAASTRPTLDVAGAQLLNPDVAETATALPENCLMHTIVEGDTPFGIAEQYGANPFLMLEANGLDEAAATGLQIGDTLVVPLEGCDVESLPTYRPVAAEGEPTFTETPEVSETPTSSTTEEATPAQSPTPRPSPTITLAPTASNAQIRILGVENLGDVTLEGVRIRSTGDTVNMLSWTMSDTNDNVYTFKEQLLFSNSEAVIYTRNGTDTAIARFWGLDRPVWELGDVVTIKDARGQVIATMRIDQAFTPTTTP